MPKKTVDIWADLKSGGTSTNPSEDFPVVKKKGSKSTSEVAAKATKQSKEKAEKNPLTHAEGTPANDINISTAVSAALSKALDEDMEVEKLGMILDTVIDQVDDADLASESFEKKSFGMVALFLVIISIISAIILIPLVIVMGYGILTIDSSTSAIELIGYETDEKAGSVSEATHFSIKSEEVGAYISVPTTPGEKVELSNAEDHGFYFHVTSDGALQIAYDSAAKAGDILTISNVDGKIVWANSEDVSEIGISLVREDEDSNNFALSIDNSTKYIGTTFNSSTKKYELDLENKAEYFSLEAQVDNIITLGDYIEDYNTLYGDTALTFGIKGNALSLYSNETHKYVNSYKQIDYSEMPFVKVESGEYTNALYTSDRLEYNFFLNPIGALVIGDVASSMNSTLSLGAYQTTAVDWSKIDSSMSSNTKTQFPLLTYSGDQVIMQQFAYAYDTNSSSTAPNSFAETQVEFVPNPHDLHQKAIYFTGADKYMTTKGGYVGLEEVDLTVESPEYFTIKHNSQRNPELISPTVDKITETTATIYATSNDFANISSVEMYLYGFQDEASARADILDAFSAPGDTQQNIVNAINRNTTDTVHSEFATKGSTLEHKLTGLEFSTRYVGTISFYRDSKGGGTQYISTLPLTFQTIDEAGNSDNSGSVEIPTPEVGDPTLTSDSPATIEAAVNTSDLENKTSLNITDSNQQQNDILGSNMNTDASKSIDVTVNLTENGEIDKKPASGIISGIRVTLYGSDLSGNIDNNTVVSTKEYSADDLLEGLDSGSYTFLFTGLEPETTYYVATSISDIEGNWYGYDPTTPEATIEAYAEPVEVKTGREVPMYNGAKPTVDKTDTRTILHVDKDGFENFSTMAGGTGDRVYLEFTTSEPSEVVTTIYVPISQVIDSYENGDTMETQSGGISVFIQDGTSSNDLRIQFDYMKPGIDYSIALYAEMGDLADTVYNDWSVESPLWAEPTNNLGKEKVVEIFPTIKI